MIFPSRSQLASKQIRRTGRAEAVTKEGLAATHRPGPRCRAVAVSIRAPARGATSYTDEWFQRQLKFQSAPPHGGRHVYIVLPIVMPSFQSAPPHGGRPLGIVTSGHPACFNPRPRTGGDMKSSIWSSVRLEFQSAPPHGGRPSRCHISLGLKGFQSAPPHGGRPFLKMRRAVDHNVSIRAPARGATR